MTLDLFYLARKEIILILFGWMQEVASKADMIKDDGMLMDDGSRGVKKGKHPPILPQGDQFHSRTFYIEDH